MKFGPTAQISFETHVFGRVQLEILIHVRDSHTILLTEFTPLASLVYGGNSRPYPGSDLMFLGVPKINPKSQNAELKKSRNTKPPLNSQTYHSMFSLFEEWQL